MFQDSGDTNPNDFSATINWGDGTSIVTGNGTVVTDPHGGFDVQGSHTYANSGFFPVSVTITHTANPADKVTATANTTASVSSGSFSGVTGVPVSGTEGTTLSTTGGVEVASFDFGSDNSESTTNFTASINWGDGNVTTGTVGGGGNSSTPFTVTGSNTYAEAGDHPVQVTITHTGTTDTGLASTTATIADATLSGQGTTFTATAGTAFSGVTVATFTDANPTPNSKDFTATIAWGDGTTSTGTVVASGSGFKVLGSHTYAAAGNFTVTTNITDNGPAGSTVPSSTAQATSTAAVSPAPVPVTTPQSPFQLFVNRAFQDLVGFQPDSGTLNLYASQLSVGIISRLSVVHQIQKLPNYLTHQIVDLYVSLLNVMPTATEVQEAVTFLDHPGNSMLGLSLQLLASDTFFALHGNNDSSFLAAVSQVFFGGSMDPTLLAQLAGMLAGGSSRAAVLQRLANALHTNASLKQEATVTALQDLYQSLVHRAATQREITDQLKALQQGKSLNEIAAELVASDEFFLEAQTPS
jgi:hypothetical protein